MKKAVVFLFLCVAAAPAAAQTLSLEECRAAAVEHNRTLRNSRLDLDAASQTRREAFTNYFPQISASGGLFQAQHGLVQADFAVPQMGTLPVSLVKRGIVGSVTAVQPLFTGLKIVTGNKLARLGEEVGRLQLQQTEAEVRERTDACFWQVVSLRDNLSTLDAVERQLAEIRRQVELSVKAGLVTNNDLLIELGAPYLRIVGLSYIFNTISSVYIGMQRSTENPAMGMIVFGISMLTNTGLNYILIFGKFGAPALGITGAAIATLTSRVLEFVIVAVYAPRYRRVPLMLRLLLRPGGAMARSFLKYATPVLVNEVLWGLGVSVMTAVMGHMAISTDMLAAHAIMGNIDKFSTVACFGIAGATAVIVGKRIGEGAGREEVYSLGCCLLTVSFGVGLVVSVCLAVLLPTVFIPYLYPLFHLEGLALEIAVTMCVVYLFMLPLKAFDITNITGLLRAGGDSRMASIIDLSCQWVIAVPLTFLTALVFNAPVAVVCLCIQSENVCKCPWGILRLRSRKWINDVTGEDT